ncbi:MAG: VanZ family protein [Sideroxyarcus sp.]|nr:VanZ family protein [Sideroxyarcus sp.]
MNAGRRSLLRRYLLACYGLMIAYASLSPFVGWQAPTSSFWQVLASPMQQAYTAFDALTNWLAYLPLGMLLALTFLVHRDIWRSLFFATLGGLLLSLAMEFAQMFLPSRASANIDVLTNTAGAFCGALLAVIIAPQSWFERITRWRIDLFQRGAGVDFGLALVLLWMFAQINPSLPMLGNVFITASPAFPALPDMPFSLWGSLAVMLNLWLTGLLLLTLFRNRRHALAAVVLILCLVALGKFIMAAALLKSWALMLWLNGEAVLGLLLGLALLGGSACLRSAQLLPLMILAAGSYMLLAIAVMDSAAPSAAMRLYHWHYGHLRNLNGMAQIVSTLFPLLLWLYLSLAYRRILNQDRDF